MKKYILLDWDGNLARTLDTWLHACRVPLEKRGLTLTDTEIASCFGAPEVYFKKWGITDIDTTLNEMDALAVELLPEVELYPDAIEVLAALRQRGKRTALITTSLRRNVIPILDTYNLHQYFDIVITSEDTEHHKPHAEPLEKALELLGGNKAEAIMIGDSDKDLGAAVNASIDSILFYPEEHRKFYSLEELQKLHPTHMVDDFRQVLDIVE